MKPDLSRILIAERGAAALRIARTAALQGIESVALFSDQDGESAWPDQLDFAVHLPGALEGWPSPVGVVERALDAGCDAVHPGWGSLARSLPLAEAMAQAGLALVGPGLEPLRAVTDHVGLRERLSQRGVACVPAGGPFVDAASAMAWQSWTGLPLMLLAPGQLPKRCADLFSLRAAIEQGLRLGPIRLERHVEHAREIELPFVGDGQGGGWLLPLVDLTWRSRGKVELAEAPAWGVPDAAASEMVEAARTILAELSWGGLGSARFLLTQDGRPYLLRLRPGLMPWAGLIEQLCGVDLVAAQLQLHAGQRPEWPALLSSRDGMAMVARLRAGGQPTVVEALLPPQRGWLDAGVVEGDPVDPGQELGLLGVTAPTRGAAIVQIRAALDVGIVVGVDIDDAHLRRALNSADYWRAPMDREAAARQLEALDD
jgi:acetyl/propionyl-CoA carboxylase alpha subunit